MFSKLLSSSDNNIFKLWDKNRDKPLFIIAPDGYGKTYWANEIFKSYHKIVVGSEFIKYSKNITDYLHSTVLKKDIFMMISDDLQYKALIVDDIQYFSQSDKSSLSKIHSFVKSLNYKQNPVIYICNETVDKCIKMMKNESYVIHLKLNYDYYKYVFKQHSKPIHNLKKLVQFTDNLNTLLTSCEIKSTLSNDISDPLDKTVLNILNTSHSIKDEIRLCTSEYSIVSLNLIENIPYIRKCYPKDMFDIYKSICVDDYIEYKYLQYNLDLDTRVFFSCVVPLHYIKKEVINISDVKYNTYISRSMIQIHNQSILNNQTNMYMDLLKNMYEYISSYTINDTTIKDIINKNNFDMKTLEKQIKVFNYYYNKTLTKKQVTKLLKQVTF